MTEFFLGLFAALFAAGGQFFLKYAARTKRQRKLSCLAIGYFFFVGSLVATFFFLKHAPLKYIVVVGASNYFFANLLGMLCFNEIFTWQKFFALLLIVLGVIVFNLGI